MSNGKLIENELSASVIRAFYDVYNELGFGFLENVYVKAITYELRSRGHQADVEIAVRIFYKGEDLCTQRLDPVVDDKLIVEVKSSELLPQTSLRQLNNYLKATSLEVGLLLHFGPEPKFYRRVLTNQTKRHFRS